MKPYLVNPETLVFNSKTIKGFSDFIREYKIHQIDLLIAAHNVVSHWTEDFPDDQGFGSSDMTYMIKEFIDEVISQSNNHMCKKTIFNPSLSVVNYSVG